MLISQPQTLTWRDCALLQPDLSLSSFQYTDSRFFFFYIANKIILYVGAIGFPTVYNQLQVVNKSFSLSAAADVALLSCLGTSKQNGVSRLQEFWSHLLHFIISDSFSEKVLFFSIFASLVLVTIESRKWGRAGTSDWWYHLSIPKQSNRFLIVMINFELQEWEWKLRISESSLLLPHTVQSWVSHLSSVTFHFSLFPVALFASVYILLIFGRFPLLRLILSARQIHCLQEFRFSIASLFSPPAFFFLFFFLFSVFLR